MDFIKPVNDNFTISSYFDDGFDLSSIFGGVGNYGLDFNTTPYAEVVAAEDGYVIGNGYNSEGYGNEIFILHDNGLITRYSNLHDYYGVSVGDYIGKYQVIGKTGKNQFHFEILDGNEIDDNSNLSIQEKIYSVYTGYDYYKKLNIPTDKARYDPYTGKNAKGEKWQSTGIFEEFPKFKNQINRDNIKTQHFIWHTCGDNKVRSSHSELDGTIHSVDENIFPGEDYNCRCWAEEIDYDLFE